jgi:NADPH-dependent 2,4-dienoyl-CoA reductase/sulfur reductase-like enzyme
VHAIEGDGERVREVVLDDGTRLRADVVVVGIGVVPAIDWLRSSGIALGDGVLCDERCATSLPDVVALGDVASWQNPLFDERMRVEHWTNAVEQAAAAATRLVQGPQCAPYAHVPMFWSDQLGIKIQGAGRPRPDDAIHVCHGTIADGRFTALFGREGRLVGCVTFHQPPKLIQYRKMIGAKASWEEALATANT